VRMTNKINDNDDNDDDYKYVIKPLIRIRGMAYGNNPLLLP
jgi:hypothetical protein